MQPEGSAEEDMGSSDFSYDDEPVIKIDPTTGNIIE
jgi:hypothetical protein